jgi:hypothetical protein
MSDTKHISEILDGVIQQRSELAKLFGTDEVQVPDGYKPKFTDAELKEKSYLRTIRYWMSKASEAQHHIEKNQKKIDALYEKGQL